MSVETTTTGLGLEQKLTEAEVREDDSLTPAEKETTIRCARDETVATIHSEISSMVKGFISHPEFQIKEIRICDDDGWGKWISPSDWDGDVIMGIKGNIPIGCLKIKSKSRKNNWHSSVI